MPIKARVAVPPTPAAGDAPGPGETRDDDDALIAWMLGLDATGRLEAAQGFVDSVEAMSRARRD